MKSGAWRSAPTASGLLRRATDVALAEGLGRADWTRERRVQWHMNLAPIVCTFAWPGSPDGQRIASAGWDRRAGYASRSGTRRPDEKLFTSSRADRSMLLRRGVQPRRPIPGHGKSRNDTVQVWDARDRRGGRHARHPRPCRSGAWCSAATAGTWPRRAATGWSNCGMRPAHLDKKQEARLTLRRRSPGQCSNVAFSPDGRRLATGGEENTVKIWDVQTGEELAHPPRDTAGTSTPWPSAPTTTADGSPRRVRTAP